MAWDEPVIQDPVPTVDPTPIIGGGGGPTGGGGGGGMVRDESGGTTGDWNTINQPKLFIE